MKEEITKTIRLEMDLNERIAALAEQVGTDHSSIIRTIIKVGLPIVERHYAALFKEVETYPLSEVTSLRAAEVPKKSARS